MNYLDDITKVVWISIHMYPIHVGKLIKKRREVYVKAWRVAKRWLPNGRE